MHTQGILHNIVANNHADVIYRGAQKPTIGTEGWEVIRNPDNWIHAQDAQGVNMGRKFK